MARWLDRTLRWTRSVQGLYSSPFLSLSLLLILGWGYTLGLCSNHELLVVRCATWFFELFSFYFQGLPWENIWSGWPEVLPSHDVELSPILPHSLRNKLYFVDDVASWLCVIILYFVLLPSTIGPEIFVSRESLPALFLPPSYLSVILLCEPNILTSLPELFSVGLLPYDFLTLFDPW